jgi:electron transfer flavoprotein alpha/beta subunit
MEKSLQIAVLSHQSCSQNRRVHVYIGDFKKIAVEIAVKIASVNRPLDSILIRFAV